MQSHVPSNCFLKANERTHTESTFSERFRKQQRNSNPFKWLIKFSSRSRDGKACVSGKGEIAKLLKPKSGRDALNFSQLIT